MKHYDKQRAAWQGKSCNIMPDAIIPQVVILLICSEK